MLLCVFAGDVDVGGRRCHTIASRPPLNLTDRRRVEETHNYILHTYINDIIAIIIYTQITRRIKSTTSCAEPGSYVVYVLRQLDANAVDSRPQAAVTHTCSQYVIGLSPTTACTYCQYICSTFEMLTYLIINLKKKNSNLKKCWWRLCANC